jgi:glucosamine--fructose-6-phosphate aminotransferase (isomerizing)
MCGIVGYVGPRKAQPILVGGLRRLEYRGYDSSGIAELDQEIRTTKAVGKIKELESRLADPQGSVGIAHTRWATHGKPSEANAHPHLAGQQKVAIVHNGIIENHAELRESLGAHGADFTSETDSEVLAHLIAERLQAGDSLRHAVRATVRRVYGTFGLVVLSADHPDELVVARRGSPLAIGVGNQEHVIASDASAIVEHTDQIVYLEDDEIASVTATGLTIETLDSRSVEREPDVVEFTAHAVEKGGYDHFMLKEIHEQPDALRDVLRGRLNVETGTAHLGGLNLTDEQLRGFERVVLVGCGTSYYAALAGEYWFERLSRTSTQAVVASEWRYSDPVVDEKTLCVVISQSGETADTLAALREAKRKGATVLGLVNVVGSTIAREVDGGIYLHAGPEIGVASTKAYITMLGALLLLAVKTGRLSTLSVFDGQRLLTALEQLPNQIAHQLEQAETIAKLAAGYAQTEDALYLGRGLSYPAVLEGSHKLKEISYIHAEAYPAGEMKHGANALIEPSLLTVFLIPKDGLYEKTKSNLEEVKAREGTILALTSEGNLELKGLADQVIYLPTSDELLTPFLAAVPLQLLAYHIAVARQTDVDQPRNLAKSVTVE